MKQKKLEKLDYKNEIPRIIGGIMFNLGKMAGYNTALRRLNKQDNKKNQNEDREILHNFLREFDSQFRTTVKRLFNFDL